MTPRILLTFFLLTFFLLAQLAAADGLDDLRLRWRQMLIGGDALDPTISQVASRLASVQSAGQRQWSSLQKAPERKSLWTDIASTTISADVSSNYSRLRDMALAWATPGQGLFQNADLLADLLSGLEWMDANRYSSRSVEYDNWWDWEIGTPTYLVDIGILIYDQLTPDQVARFMGGVERFDSNPAIMIVNTVSTGANLADKCKNALLRGLIVRDPAKVALAVKLLTPVFAYVTSSDGFYVDGSFIQHTRHPYTHSYGLVLLQDITNLLYLLSGSEWDVTVPTRANVDFWVTDGFAPLIYKGAAMDMVRGRAISRSGSPDHGIGHSIIASLLRYTQFAAPEIATPLLATIKRWLLDDITRDFSSGMPLDLIPVAAALVRDDSIVPADQPVASRVYASMDRVVHLRPTWAAGIAMHSSRIYNYESINRENLKAWHTGDGMLYLYNSDLLQFADMFWPTVDPQRLPGTTIVAGATETQSQVGGSSAVGGASVDGYSIAMMQLNPVPRQLNAKKSWFLFDNEIVALGADIRSTAASGKVETIIDNRRLTVQSDFTSDPNGAWAAISSRITGANIGYYFPDGKPWQSATGPRTGAWLDLNAGGSATKLTASYQTLWFDHGIVPSAESYAYVVLPGMSPEDTAAYAASPSVQIAANDARVQAVVHPGIGIQAANFWSNASATAAGITSDSIASVLVHQANGIVNIAVADPTQANNGIIHLEIEAAAQGVLAQDEAVTVDQLSPTLRLSVNVRGAKGKSLRLSVSQ